MAISPSFSVSQSAITPASFTTTDTSTGTYGTITKRRIYVSDANGTYLTGNGTVNYNDWVLANLSITLSVLQQDTAANIKVEWLDVSDNVIDSVNTNYPLSEFGKQFLFYLIQLQGLSPGVIMDTNYSGNLAIFIGNILGGDNAVSFGNDLAGAQNCYNRETEMQQKQSFYFGTPTN